VRGHACGQHSRLQWDLRQASPIGQAISTYCLPGRLPCVSFRPADNPIASTVAPGAFDGILGSLISPDDRTLTVIWNGLPTDRAVIVEQAHQVKVGIDRTGPYTGGMTVSYFGASARLAAPLAGRTVRLSQPEPQCD